MDSSPTTGVGVPQPEMPSIRFDDGKLQRTNRWLIGAVIVLAVAVVALGVALIASSTEETPAPPAAQPTTEGLADSAIADSLEDWFTAQNTGAPVGDFYAEDAVLELRNESPPQVLRGRERIVAHYEPSPGTAIPSSVVAMPSTDVLQVGDFAVVGYSYPGGGGFALTRFDGDLKIVHQWVVGW